MIFKNKKTKKSACPLQQFISLKIVDKLPSSKEAKHDISIQTFFFFYFPRNDNTKTRIKKKIFPDKQTVQLLQ